MTSPHPPGSAPGPDDSAAALPFATLLYRFMFFDWLFMDMRTVHNLFELHAARVHNQRMARYLPVYLRRWSILTACAFGLGCLFDRGVLSAWCFTWSCVTLTGMVVIGVAWAILTNARLS